MRFSKLTRSDFEARDNDDPLGSMREAFVLPPGVTYLDGNSLGALPRAAAQRVQQVVEHQWAQDLIRSWTQHDWIDLPQRTGDKIAGLVGAAADEVICIDSTSLNLFRAVAGAVRLRPERSVILAEEDNFPADNYIAEGIRWWRGTDLTLRHCPGEALADAVDETVAVVLASHVNFRTGRRLDMTALNRAAHAAGALTVWDLSHSVGAMPIDLHGAQADLAAGCGYKYLNGGPGAPAFLYVAKRLQEQFRSPLWGWLGHAEPFAFEPTYRPAPTIRAQQAGTPPILSMAALDAALDVFGAVDLHQVRTKSMALGQAFIELVEQRCGEMGMQLVSPKDPEQRGSQVSLRHPEGYAVIQALIARGVIGDFRTPDNMRFGFSPLYLRYVDIWDAVEALRDVLASRAWDRPEFKLRAKVT